MADNYIFQKALNEPLDPQRFKQKTMLFAIDQNNNSYNGQIILDTSVLSSSGKWLDYSQGYFQVPFLITLQSSADITATANAFMLGLKNGSHQIIDSIQVDYNNVNVVQLQPFSNFYIGYRMMTSFSQSDLDKWGDVLNFTPDTAASSSFTGGAAAGGNGTSNNVVYPVTGPSYTAGPIDTYNAGFYRRLKETSYSLLTAGQNVGGNTEINSTSLANNVGKNYVADNAGAAAARVYQWVIMLTIRLKDISSFFEQLPLVKGAFLRFTINYNSTLTSVTSVAAGPTLTQAAPTILSGRSCPIMMSSSAANNPMNAAVAGGAGATFSVACGVKSTSSPASTLTPPISACRLYVPSYDLISAYEIELIESEPTRIVRYRDIYNYNVLNIGAGASFTQLLTNGMINPKAVIVIPQLNNVAANAATISLYPYQSLFDTSPATTAPYASILNFNVQIAGANAFQQSEQFDWEAFMNETVQPNAVNGAQMTGLTSGLIGRHQWDGMYRYYVCNVARRVPSADDTPISLTIQGVNNTSKIMDYICFVEFERKIILDMATGNLVSQ